MKIQAPHEARDRGDRGPRSSRTSPQAPTRFLGFRPGNAAPTAQPAHRLTEVVVANDRETGKVAVRVIEETDSEILNSFVDEHASPDAEVYTDGATVYKGRENHEAVAHSIGEYVRGHVHTNGVESFRSMLKRGYMGVDHRMSPKHLQRYVNEFAGRHNILDLDTLDQMAHVVAGMVGQRLLCRDLTTDSGRSRVAT